MDVSQCTTPKVSLCLPLWCLHAVVLSSVGASAAAAGAASTTWAPTSGNKTDWLSLLAFKDGIARDPTDGLKSWNSSLQHCRWSGVTCGRRHPERVTALDLRSLSLHGHISPSIANLTFLRRIDLSDNQLQGIIPPQLGALFWLRYLNLSSNNIGGEIPSNMSYCSNIQVISVQKNHLVGQLPASLGRLSKLVRLIVFSNQLAGAIPPALGNLSSDHFRVLSLADNTLTGGIPSELGRLTGLWGFLVGLNNLSGTIPPSLYNLSKLDIFEVVFNQLSGALPSDLGAGLPRMTILNMVGNQFEGYIPCSLSNASSLQSVTLQFNRLRGTIPDILGSLRYLQQFGVSANGLEARKPNDWNFLTSLSNCTNLKLVAIEKNKLQGALPNSITNLSASLEVLLMGANQISGSIPMGIGDLRGLFKLGMGRNQFSGRIPPTLGRLQNLEGLELKWNQLTGEIPLEIGNLTLLSELYLDHNKISGNIPTSLGQCQRLQLLNVSRNRLSGSIPNELFVIFSLARLDLSNNFLEGPLPSDVGRLVNLRYFDISLNRLSSYLPPALGDCQSMEQLYLHGNSFGGTIPLSLRNLRGIEALDLSLNNLTGEVPKFLEDLKFLEYLNLSFNNFIGEVPRNGVFSNASIVSLLGIKMICGGISALHLPPCASKVEERRNHYHSLKIIISIAIGGILCLLLSLGFITYCCWMRKSKGKTSTASLFEFKHKKISYHDLVKATDGFSHNNLIGKGSFGSVYKGILDGEKVVAVKVLDIQRRGALKSFKSECEALRNIRHRNLVKIVSVCSSIDFSGNDFKALVFEFLPNGSLERWLHPELEVETRTLDFSQRLCIVADVASALDYLHNHCHSPIIHCDLKPSNVLLDSNMSAYVGDFGLARFILASSSENLGNQSSTIGIKGTIGYVAPEYGLGSPISIYGDVYSFGILVLELFTARRPIDDVFTDGLTIQKLVEAALLDQAMSVIDPRLILQNNEAEHLQNAQNSCGSTIERMQECFVSLMGIGLNCTKESPQERMTMRDVVKEIRLIQETLLGVARSVES